MLERFPNSALVPAALLAAIIAMGAMMIPSVDKMAMYFRSPAGSAAPINLPAPRAGADLTPIGSAPVSFAEAR